MTDNANTTPTVPEPSAIAAPIAWSEPLLAWFLSRLVCIIAIILGGALFPIERYYPLKRENPNAGPQADPAQ